MVFDSQTKIMSLITSHSSLIPQLSQVTLPNYNFPFKLEKNNYVIWEAQIFSAIEGSNLEGFITGTIQPQPEFTTIQSKDDSRPPKRFRFPVMSSIYGVDWTKVCFPGSNPLSLMRYKHC